MELIVSDCSKPPSNELCNLVQRTIKYLCHSFRSGAGGLRLRRGRGSILATMWRMQRMLPAGGHSEEWE